VIFESNILDFKYKLMPYQSELCQFICVFVYELFNNEFCNSNGERHGYTTCGNSIGQPDFNIEDIHYWNFLCLSLIAVSPYMYNNLFSM
jgi:hypothetical protein